jgi:hypothetical protein
MNPTDYRRQHLEDFCEHLRALGHEASFASELETVTLSIRFAWNTGE